MGHTSRHAYSSFTRCFPTDSAKLPRIRAARVCSDRSEVVQPCTEVSDAARCDSCRYTAAQMVFRAIHVSLSSESQVFTFIFLLRLMTL